MRPLEAVTERERTPVLIEGRVRLTAALEDRAEVGVHGRQVRRPNFDLLELVGGFVEHLEVEVDPPERDGEREVVGCALEGITVQRDHPTRSTFLAVVPLEPGEQRQRRHGLGSALPGADGFTVFAVAVDESPDDARPWVEEAQATNGEIAKALGLSRAAVGQWRQRFVRQGLAGLYDAPRPGGACER